MIAQACRIVNLNKEPYHFHVMLQLTSVLGFSTMLVYSGNHKPVPLLDIFMILKHFYKVTSPGYSPLSLWLQTISSGAQCFTVIGSAMPCNGL